MAEGIPRILNDLISSHRSALWYSHLAKEGTCEILQQIVWLAFSHITINIQQQHVVSRHAHCEHITRTHVITRFQRALYVWRASRSILTCCQAHDSAWSSLFTTVPRFKLPPTKSRSSCNANDYSLCWLPLFLLFLFFHLFLLFLLFLLSSHEGLHGGGESGCGWMCWF